MNEWYAKDTSAKITAVFKSRMKNGLRCSGAVPFGYYRVPGDKQTLHVDREAAKVIQKIFKLIIEGKGVVEIANILTEEEVLIPSAYNEIHHPSDARHHSYHNPYLWTATAVTHILEKREYTGCTVLGKTVLENFKTKKRRKATEEELMIFPDTHEAIIDGETWKLAQEIRKKKGRHRKLANGTNSHILSGYVYCADCGSRMYFHSQYSQHRKDGKHYDADNCYRCPKASNVYGEKCSLHYIKASTLETLVLNAIKAVSSYALDDEVKFVEQISAEKDIDRDKEIKSLKKKLSECRHRVGELDILIKKLYEQNALGKMSDRQYDKLMSDYNKEQSQLENEMSELETKINSDQIENARTDKFLESIRKYTDISELTSQMVHEFIDRIEVHKPVRSADKIRRQNIDIYFNFIGKIDLSCICTSQGSTRSGSKPNIELFSEKVAI
jgi:hypothetical protein